MKKIVVSICISIALLFSSISPAFAEEYDTEEDTAAVALAEETADEETAAASERGDDDKDVSQTDNSGQTLAEYTGQLYHIDIRVAGTFTYEASYDAIDTILDIEKIWEDDEEHEDITVYLLGENGEVLTDDDGNDRYVTLGDANDWYTELEADDVYAVKEEDVDGYTASYEYDISADDEDTEEYSTTGSITVEAINWVTYTDSSGNTVIVTGAYTKTTSESGAEYAYEFFCSDRTLEDFYDTSTINISLTFAYSYIDENGNEQSDELTKTFTFTADTESNTCANLTANSDDDDSNDIYDETMYGYDAVITFEMDDIITTKQTISAVITNTPEEEETYALVLSKSVSGTDTDDVFSFDIYIDGAEGVSYNGIYVSEDGEEEVTIAFNENGHHTIQLKAGESLYIYGLTEGTAYEITEIGYGYYTPYVNSVQTDTANGTIDGDVSVEFVNEYEFLELDYDADIDITKVFTGDADTSASFCFTIEPLSDAAAEKYAGTTVEISMMSLTADDLYTLTETISSVFGTLHFTQDDIGQTFTYTISEAVPDDAEDGYVYDDSVYTVSFTVGSDGSSLYVDTLITDADGNEVDEIIFYNTYEMPTGSLLISKEVIGDAPDDTFAFTIEAYLADGSPLDGTYSGYTFTDGLLTIYLKSGEEVLIEGLPVGVTYTITEEEYDDYATTVNGEAKRTLSGTITANVIDTAAFVNEYDPPVVSTMPKTGDDSLATLFMLLIAGLGLMFQAILRMKNSFFAGCAAEKAPVIDTTDERISAAVQVGPSYKTDDVPREPIRKPDDPDRRHKKRE